MTVFKRKERTGDKYVDIKKVDIIRVRGRKFGLLLGIRINSNEIELGGITMGNVLLVDYNTNQRILYEMVLREDGYNVVSVGSAKEALLNVEVWSPDIIVLDILMPDMDGIQLIGRLFNKKHKIVVHTAYETSKNNLMMCGVDAYILKSSDLTRLKNKLRELLELPKELKFQRCSNN